MSSAPVPAKLIFLSDLAKCPTGSKVRFLGCISHYDESSATATLTHNHPPRGDGDDSDKKVEACVNVDLVLESLDASTLQIGSWVNVVGYTSDQAAEDDAAAAAGANVAATGISKVSVRAVMLWSAGDFKLSSYEARLQERIDAGTAGC